MRILTIALMTFLLLVISGCGQSYNPERDRDCRGCDLNKADLAGAYLTGANLDDVIGADFTDARNVPAKYLKD